MGGGGFTLIHEYEVWDSTSTDATAELIMASGIQPSRIFTEIRSSTWKFKSNTLINNHFIIKYKVHGIVTRHSRRDIPQRHRFSM